MPDLSGTQHVVSTVPTSTPQTPKSGGGGGGSGFWGKIKSSLKAGENFLGGAEHAVGGALTGTAGTIAQVGTGIGQLFYTAGQEVAQNVEHPLRGPNALTKQEWSDIAGGHIIRALQEPSNPKFKGIATSADIKAGQIATGAVQSTYVPIEHPLRDPTQTI